MPSISLMRVEHDHPKFMSDAQVLASCTSMIFAGSETTAIGLSSVFLNLLRNPAVHSKLMHELDEAIRTGAIEDRPNRKVSWTEAQKLPYLDAVINESFRLHPPAGLTLERVVPPQGSDILGNFVPGGTIVGCMPPITHVLVSKSRRNFNINVSIEARREIRLHADDFSCHRQCLGLASSPGNLWARCRFFSCRALATSRHLATAADEGHHVSVWRWQ